METIWKSSHKFDSKSDKQFQQFFKSLQKQMPSTELFAKLLWIRNLRDVESVMNFISPDEKEIFSYYKNLHDIDAAVNLINKNIKEKNKIIIYGDYDVDGVTSTSLLWRCLYNELKADVMPFVPHREKQGYGLNYDAIAGLLEKEKDRNILLIAIDCGIRDGELIEKLKKKYRQLKIIVADHHQFPDKFNESNYPADVLVHPLSKKSEINPKEICACAIAWALVCGLRNAAKIKESRDGLELVALATVCDVMPLNGINRAIVTAGLKQFARSENPGVKASLSISATKPEEMKAYHLGYILGPRINAAGRLGDAMLAVRMLCTPNFASAMKYAKELDQLNQTRQAATSRALEILKQDHDSLTEKLLFVQLPELEEGIAGLVAGKLQEIFYRPVIVLTRKKSKKNMWVGSARSNDLVDITGLLNEFVHLLARHGGHAQAAGLSVVEENISELKNALVKRAGELIPDQDHKRTISYDLDLDLKNFSYEFIGELEKLEPFGNGNETPQFLLQNTLINSPRFFGAGEGNMAFQIPDSIMEAIWFGQQLDKTSVSEQKYDFIGGLGYNEWQGRKIPQFKIRHHRLSSE